MRNSVRFSLCLLALSVLAVAGSAVAVADAEADLTVEDAVETPAETIELEGSEYEVDEIAVIEPGDPIEMRVASDEHYYAILYDTDGNAQHREYAGADQSVVTMGTDDDVLDTSYLEPGTYMLSLEPDGEGREAVTPVVVQGYDLALEYPASGERDGAIDLAATVESTSDRSQPAAVEVAVGDGDGGTDVTLEHEGGNAYGGTLSPSALEAGTYDVYGAVVGDETVEGYPVAYAATDGPSLSVTDDGDGEIDDGAGNESENGDGTNGDGASDGSGAGDSDVIAPNGDRDGASETDRVADDDGLGAGPVAALIALALSVALAVRRGAR